MMTQKEKNDKIAHELREMCTALGYKGASDMLTQMRSAYFGGKPVIVCVGGECASAEREPVRDVSERDE